MAPVVFQKLGTRLTLVVSFGLLIIATGSVALSVHAERTILMQEFRREGAAVAKTVAAMSLEPMLSADVTVLQTHVNQLTAVQGRVVHVAIRGRKGVLLVQAGNKETTSEFEERFVAPVNISAEGVAREKVGEVAVRYDMVLVSQLLERVVRGASGGVVLSLLMLSLFVWFFMRRTVIGPIAQLDQEVAALSSGFIERPIRFVPREDEIGRLARSVEELRRSLCASLDGIEARRTELERLNHQLLKEKHAFVRFVPSAFADLLGRASASEIKLGDSEQRTVTVLFSDIRGFTSLAEQLDPASVLKMLNRYLARMDEPIREHGGFVDKFMGDAIMALFTDSGRASSSSVVKLPSADRGLRAALDMRRGLQALNETAVERGERTLKSGVALHIGSVVLGSIGTVRRLDTTVIGDPVNVAARIEALTKDFDSEVLISEELRSSLSRPDDYEMRVVARSVLRGRHESTTVYEVCDSLTARERGLRRQTQEVLEAGIDALEEERFAEASRCFREGHRLDPEDAIFDHYVKRAERQRRFISMSPDLMS